MALATALLLGIALMAIMSIIMIGMNTGVHEWFLWGAAAAKNGFTATASKAGYPDTYSITGNTCQVRDISGIRAFMLGGMTGGVTKTGGGRVKGDKSWSGIYSYLPSLGDNDIPMFKFDQLPPREFQRAEYLTGEIDSVNVNEASWMTVLMAYGAQSIHEYPKTMMDMIRKWGLKLKTVHTPQISITSAAAVTSGSGGATLESCSQEDYWITRGKKYYILGFLPHLVNNNGILQVKGGVPQDAKVQLHKDCIPFMNGAPVVTFRGTNWCLPYEPIGPFGMDEQPSLGLFSSAAIATTGALAIGEVA